MNRCWEYLPNRKSYIAKTLRNLAKFGNIPTCEHLRNSPIKMIDVSFEFPTCLFLSLLNIQVKIHTSIAMILLIKNEITFKIQSLDETSFRTFRVNTR